MKQYSYKNIIYSVVSCTLNDIPFHIERVLSYWANTDINKQKEYLIKAVKDNTAFKVIQNNDVEAFIYYNLSSRRIGQSNLLWFKDKRKLAILCYYLREHKNILKLFFKPHNNTIPFEFLVEDKSIMLNYSNKNSPLEIYLYSKKCYNLYYKHFLKYGIKEL